MSRRLSSRATPVFKAIPLALTALAVGRLLSSFHEGSWKELIFFAGVCCFFYLLCFNLKSVALEGRSLIVSNYLRTIRVPLSEVWSVTEAAGRKPQTITLRLRRASEFGHEVVFIPAGDIAAVGAELRELIGTCSRAWLGESPIGAARVTFLRRYAALLRRRKR